MFKENELVFVAWTVSDWKTNTKRETDYHLAQCQEGVYRTSCGMVILNAAEQPSYADLTEPSHLKVCSVCSSRAAEFSKKHFKGRKLNFKRSSIKNSAKGRGESDEEAYRQTAKASDQWNLEVF